MKAHRTSALLVASILLTGCQSTPFSTLLSRKGNAPAAAQMTQQGLTQNPASGDPNQTGRPNAGSGSQGQPVMGAASGTQTPWGSTQTGVEQLLSQGHAAFLQADRMERENRFADAHRFFAHAQSYYQRVLQHVPNHANAHHRLAVIADKQHDFPTAESHYLSALGAEPYNADLLSDLGYSYFLQGRYAESERYLQQALQRTLSHPQALNNLGLLYARQGDRDRALAMFRRTGTEAEAQAKLAQVLPALASAGSTPSSVPAGLMSPTLPTPSNAMETIAQPPLNWPSQTAAVAPPTTSPVGANSGPSEQTLRLKAMMEQARLQSLAERQQPQATLPASPPASQSPPGWGHQTSPNLAQVAPNGLDPTAAGRVPDSQIGGLFRQIDQAGGAPPAQSTTRPNPLETMPVWPSQSTPSVVAPARPQPPSGQLQQPQSYIGPGSNSTTGTSSGLDDPAKRAAFLGMQAGPGQIFPVWGQSTNGASSSAAPSPAGPMPMNGVGAAVSGAQSTTTPAWSFPAQSTLTPNASGGSNAPAFSGTTGNASGIAPAFHQSAAPAGGPQPQGAGTQTDPLAEYERQIQQHNAERAAIQKLLDAQRQLLDAQRQMPPTSAPQWPYAPAQDAASHAAGQANSTVPGSLGRTN